MIKQGESLFVPFLKGQGVPDAHYRARTYKSIDACRKALKCDFDKVEVVEYAPVKHGEFERQPEECIVGLHVTPIYCKTCDTTYFTMNKDGRRTICCPYCGVKMDGGT